MRAISAFGNTGKSERVNYYVIVVILTLVGSVLGSGFISGKEVAVFFSRFGGFSFLGIFLAFFLFAGIFYLILIKSDIILSRLQNSKIILFLNLIISIVFSSAMMAGIVNSMNFDIISIKFAIFFIILLICLLIIKKGIKILNKLNSFLVPIMIIIFLILLSLNISQKPIDFSFSLSGSVSIFYSFLYAILNTSNGVVLTASLGQKLAKHQKAQVSVLSALVLMLILLFVNIVLLQHSSLLYEDMPFLSLFSGWQKVCINIVIFIGCATSLFSLVYTSFLSFRGLCNNEFLIFCISVLLPALLSLLGFSFIVSQLYPICSILGLYLLFALLKGQRVKKTKAKSIKRKENL